MSATLQRPILPPKPPETRLINEGFWSERICEKHNKGYTAKTVGLLNYIKLYMQGV